MNWRKWNEGKALRRERARKAAEVRWARHRERLSGAPVRTEERVEIVIRSSLRTQRTIVATRTEGDEGRWGRWKVAENGTRCRRRWSGRALGLAIGRTL